MWVWCEVTWTNQSSHHLHRALLAAYLWKRQMLSQLPVSAVWWLLPGLWRQLLAVLPAACVDATLRTPACSAVKVDQDACSEDLGPIKEPAMWSKIGYLPASPWHGSQGDPVRTGGPQSENSSVVQEPLGLPGL